MRRYSMAYLTANGLPPVQAIEAAAKAGYDDISFRLLPAGRGDTPPDLMGNDALMADVMAALAETGLGFSDAEMIRLDDGTDLETFRPFLERIRTMGARHILVAGDDPDRARLIDSYGRLCEMVHAYGLTADLEFMPWTPCRALADARQIVEAVAHPAAAILFDALHFDRAGSTLDELAAIPADLMNYAQICDGPRPYDPAGPAMMALGRTARLIPSEGAIDLPAIAARLPDGLTISVEVPNVALCAGIGAEAIAKRSLEATKALMQG